MTPTCVRCKREMPDQAYACRSCTDRAERHLAEIVDMTPPARDVAHGQARRGTGGGSTGKPGSRLPIDLRSSARLDAVQAQLTKWVDHIGTERGTTRPWFTNHGDPIVTAAHWLANHLEWMRHRTNADEFLTDVDACARVVRGIARGPVDQRYLGPCGALILPESDETGPEVGRDGNECAGDVYGPQGGSTGSCRTCGARVSQDERRAWLDAEVRQHAYRAAQIEDAYGVDAGQIRVWAARGQLRGYWITEAGLTAEWTDPGLDPALTGEELKARLGEIADEIQARGPRVFYLGDVLDLAAAQAVRRAEAQAKRARREAAAAEREAEEAA